MANTQIRQYKFYPRYVWNAVDFENFQQALTDEYRGIFEVFGGAYSNIELSLTTGLNVTAASGIAIGGRGRILTLATSGTVAFASPSVNPAKSLLILRPSESNQTPIAEPTNTLNTVYLNKQLDTTLMVLNGTPAASPSYPTIQDGDLILAGVSLTAGQTTLLAANFDFDTRNIPRLDLIKKKSYSSRIIGDGSVVYAPSLNIQSGHTWTGAGDIHAPGIVTGLGVLATTGLMYS